MPSPVGHGLGVLALAWFTRELRTASDRRAFGVGIAVMAVAAIAPDFDFVPGILIGQNNRFHHGPSHSFAAAAIVGIVCWAVVRARGIGGAARIGWLAAGAYASHIVLDMLTSDGQPPIGVPAFWPVMSAGISAPFHVFLDIKRSAGEPNFFVSLLLPHNADALLREAAIVGGVLAVMWVGRRARRRAGREVQPSARMAPRQTP